MKSVAQVRIPKGEAYARVEGARGEVGCYLDRRRQRQAVPHEVARRVVLQPRGRCRTSFPGHKVADVVAIMGSVDPVFGEVDR